MVNAFESEKHHNENIKPIARKVLDVILEFGESQNTCPKIDDCDHVVREMKRLHLNIPQANGYITLVCEKYPLACELNQKELDYARSNK